MICHLPFTEPEQHFTASIPGPTQQSHCKPQKRCGRIHTNHHGHCQHFQQYMQKNYFITYSYYQDFNGGMLINPEMSRYSENVGVFS